jgi:hypothetical protein
MPVNNKVFFISIIFLADLLFAQVPFVPHLSSRSRAMGGTVSGYVNGVDALFHNPAALYKVEGYVFDIGKVNAAASTNSQRLLDQTSSSTSSLGAADLQALYGETFFSEVSAHSGMVIPRFGFAVFSQNYISEVFNNPVFPTFTTHFLSDYGYTIGASFPLGSNSSFGVAGRHTQRWSGNEEILVTDLIGTNDRELINSRFTNKGVGDGFDLALHHNIPSSNLNFALVWKDVGTTVFKPTSGIGPERQDDNLSFGISKSDSLGVFDTTYAFEYKHIRQSGELVRKLHFGTEASLGLLDLRFGINQGYLTYGVGVDLWLVSIDATAYSEEVTDNNGAAVKNDRYQATLTFALDLDQSLKIKNSFGKKRRLMQRR